MINFILIGVLLVILLAGGVYVVRQQSTQRTQIIGTPTPSAPSQSTTGGDTPSSGATREPDNHQATNAPSDQSAKPSVVAPSVDDHASKAELPHTGPVETINVIIAIGALSGMLVAYERSRRFNLSL